MPRRLVLIAGSLLALLLVLLLPRPAAAAEIQVSDLFKDTAKALARYGLEEVMDKACQPPSTNKRTKKRARKGSAEEGSAETESTPPDAAEPDALRYQLCVAFVDALHEFVVAAIDGELDKEVALAEFRRFQRRAILAVATYGYRQEVAKILLGSLLDSRISEARLAVVQGVVSRASTCIAATLLGSHVEESCKPMREGSPASPCSASDDASPTKSAKEAFCRIRSVAEESLPAGGPRELASFAVVLALVEDTTIAALGSGTVFDRARVALHDADEKAGFHLGWLAGNVAFDPDTIADAQRDLQQYPEAQCPSADKRRLLDELSALARSPLTASEKLGRHVSTGTVPPRSLLPASTLGACRPVAGDFEHYVAISDALVLSARIHAQLLRWRPALLSAAMFIDELSSPSEEQLHRNARGLIVELAHVLLAQPRGTALVCKETQVERPDRVTIGCTDMHGVAVDYAFEGRNFGDRAKRDGNDVIMERLSRSFTVAASRATCVGQLIGAAAAGDRVDAFGTFGPVCVLDPAFDELESILLPAAERLGLRLEDLAPTATQPATGRRLKRWAGDSVELGATSARLRITPVTGKELAAEGVLMLAEAYAASPAARRGSSAASTASLGAAVTVAQALAGPLLRAESIEPAAAFGLASQFFAEPVEAFIAKAFTHDDCKKKPNRVGCLVSAQAVALYEPLLQYSAGIIDEDELLREAARSVQRIDPFSHSPLFLSFGIAYSGIWTPDTLSHHLTVLDKWGLAYRFGKRNQGHVGAFVGGFIDALVRTALDGSENSYWLAGAMLGARQLYRKMPLGFEAHVAAAPRADFAGIGLAFGVALTVPFELLLNKD